MKLEKFALLSEIIGSLAVVATLVVVIVEIRSNTSAVQVTSYQQAIQMLIDQNNTIAMDPELSQIVAVGLFGRDPQSLNARDRVRLSVVTENFFLVFETAFLSREYGQMNEREWQRWPPIICNIYGIAVGIDLWEGLRGRFTRGFTQFVEACPTNDI